MSTETGDRISRIYANFRGADFRGEEINIRRSPDCLNVWKDYKETERAVKKFTALFLCLYICSGSLSAADPLTVLGRGTAVVLFEIAAQ